MAYTNTISTSTPYPETALKQQCQLNDLGERLNKCNSHLREIHERLTRVVDRTLGENPENVKQDGRSKLVPAGTLGSAFALADDIDDAASAIESALRRLETL